MEEKVKIKAIAEYNGHSVRTNKNVDISFKFSYDEITNYIRLIQCLNNDVTIFVKVGDGKADNVGVFRIKDIHVDHDGEGRARFNSMTDYVNTEIINSLVGTEKIQVLFTASIDTEEEASEDE